MRRKIGSREVGVRERLEILRRRGGDALFDRIARSASLSSLCRVFR